MSNPTKALTAPSTAYLKAVGGPKEGLKAIAEYAQKHSPEGVTPRTHVVKDMVTLDTNGKALNSADAELRVSTPHEILRESAYGDFFPQVQQIINNNRSNVPVPKQWEHVTWGNMPTYMFHFDEPNSVMATHGISNTFTGSNNWGVLRLGKPWDPPANRSRSGYLRNLLHEAGHLAAYYPNGLNSEMTPGFDLAATSDQLIKENQGILDGFTDEGRLKEMGRLLWGDTVHRNHVNKQVEMGNVLSELRREHYQQHGTIPSNMNEAEHFIEQIFDEAPKLIDPNATNMWNLWGPDPVRKFGPMKGTRSEDAPGMRRHIKDLWPKDKVKHRFLLKGLLESAGTDGGRPDAV